MRIFKKSAFFLSMSALMLGCGRQNESTSPLSDDRPVFPLASRFDAPQLLDVLSEVPDNARVPMRNGLTVQQLDAAIDALDGKIRVDAAQNRLSLESTFGSALTARQKTGFGALQRGYALRLREGAVRLAGNAIVPADGRYGGQGPGIGVIDFDGRDQGSEVQASGSEPIAPEHRVGDGRWSWRLSYKWWGVRLYVNHNFLNYLCHNTEWMLSHAGLPGWIKIIIRPLGCLLHGLDTGADGSSISITWAGVFWYTP